MNKPIIMYMLILIAVLAGAAPTFAIPLTYTDVSCVNSGATTCSSSIYVYYVNGTLAGVLNTTGDVVNINGTEPINLYLKPNSVSLLNNPSFTLNWILNSWNMFFTILLVFGLLVAMFFVIKKIFYRGDVAPIGTVSNNKDGWSKKRW